MSLAALKIRDFRCIPSAQLEFDSLCTVISGPNASGKTSLLEAIHTLSCGHSFRATRRELLIKSGEKRFEVIGEVTLGNRKHILGLAGERGENQIRVDGEIAKGFVRNAELLPVRVIDPQIHELIAGSPDRRREFMDWGVFHVEQEYARLWRRFQRVLKQRNAALKAKLPPSDVAIWNDEFITTGEAISRLRRSYLEELASPVATVSGNLGIESVTLQYQTGWSAEQSLEEAVHDAREADARYATTTVGPHRGDFQIRVDNERAKYRVSRGQEKLLAAALVTAQVLHMESGKGQKISFLLDDPAAELDVDNFKKLIKTLSDLSCQLIITALDPKPLDTLFGGSRFHVEQGFVKRVL